MGTFTTGPAATAGIDFRDIDLDDFFLGAVDITPTLIRLGSPPTDFVELRGRFTLKAGEVASGTINEIETFENNKTVYEVSGISVSVATLSSAWFNDDTEGFLKAVFKANDSITGSLADDFMVGYGGNDTVSGLEGADTLNGDAGNDSLEGGSENDSLVGAGGNDTLNGGAGNDDMDGGAGNDIYVVDGANDKAAETGIGAAGGTDTVQTFAAAYTLGLNIENLTLADTADIDGTGNVLANTLTGNSGNNELSGEAGKDRLIGGDGNDTLSGGADNDTLDGGLGNDNLDGGVGDDSMAGGAGDDLYEIDSTKDKVTESLTNDKGGGQDTVHSSVSFTLGKNLDDLVLLDSATPINGTGNTLANALTGNEDANRLNGLAGADKLAGLAGNDTLDGGTGNDTMVGGDDDDLYVVDTAGDLADEQGMTLGDELRTNQVLTDTTQTAAIEHYTFTGSKAMAFTGSDKDNRITAAALADKLDGGEGNDTLSGLAGNDSLVGGLGNDDLNGGAGSDTVLGGEGDDVYFVDAAGDKLTENADEGTDEVRSAISYVLGASVENLTLQGTGAINATGNDLANVINGNDGANKIDGGKGADEMAGGKGNDTYTVDHAGDIVTEDANAGSDLVLSGVDFELGANVERLTLQGNAVAGEGNELANAIIGSSKDNELFGNDGKDTLTGNDGADTLDGGLGADSLIGGKGGDVYIVDNLGDKASESLTLATGGKDRVESSVSFTLGANLDDLLLTGGGTINGIGNTLANEITGNDQNNKLAGMAGNDTLVGSGGNDALDGSTGADAAAFAGNSADYEVTTKDGVTTVKDLNTGDGDDGTDTLTGIERLAFADDLVVLVKGTAGHDSPKLTAAADSFDGLAGNDTLQGLAGADILMGGADGDLIVGGAGDDTANGGAGADEYRHAVGDGFDIVTGADNLDHVLLTGTHLYDLNFNRVGNDLVVSAAIDRLYDFSATGSITIKDHYLGSSIAFVLIDTIDNDSHGTDPTITKAAFTTDLANGLNNVEFMEILLGSSAGEVINGNGGFYDQLYGAGGNDTITSGNSSDFLHGGGGDDQLFGNDGDDRLGGSAGSDALDGGDGTDWADYLRATAGITVNLSIGAASDDGDGGQDKLISVENVRGSQLDDIITGDAGENIIRSRGGNDSLFGGDGFDLLIGDAGNDTLHGGLLDEDDEAAYDDSPGSIIANLSNTVQLGVGAGQVKDGFGTLDTLINIEGILATGKNDTIIGGAADEFFEAMGGNDSLNGGAGFDEVNFTKASEGVTVNLTKQGAAQFISVGQGSDVYKGFEAITGSFFNDTLTGDSGDNFIDARNGNDSISGGAGFDALRGAKGDDTIIGGAADDQIDGGDGRDQVRYTSSPGGVVVDLTVGTAQDGFGGTDTLISIERVVGSAFNDQLTGNNGIDANLLGSKGNDTIDGDGSGFASYFDSPGNVTANLTTGTASDGWGNTDKLIDLRGLSGSKNHDTLIGNGNDNWFEGGAGKDSISGGAGHDVVDYNGSDGGIVVNLSTGTATDNFGFADKLSGIEEVWASNDADKLTGSAAADALWAADGGDTMTGGGGADVFLFSGSASEGDDVVTDFNKASDVLHFFDVVDQGAPGLDLDDLEAAIISMVDNGAGQSVVLTFDNGGTVTFKGAGTGAVNSVDDLVASAATQIVIT